MRIRSSILLGMLSAALSCDAPAQVLSPAEITDPAMKGLQQTHLKELHEITAALTTHQYPYHFYFSRKLDLTLHDQERSDQRSIQFDKFRGQTVLKITGNYFAAYSAERMTREDRARQTFTEVMLPILQAAVPALARTDVPDAFALEISHHVVRKVLGVDNESMENVVLILPRASAGRLIEATDEAGRIAAVDEGTAYLNAIPISFWPGDVKDGPPVQVSMIAAPPAARPVIAPVPAAPPAPPHPTSTPAKLEEEYRDTVARMLKDLDSQAHFVPYAPPSFIAFRNGQYLQIPMATALTASDSGSQYKLAALAFDRHVAHLIRPFLGYFKDSVDFTGVDFSTSIHLGGAKDDTSESVEFIFPLSALRSYAQYDLTGQQLLDAGFVLINGERAGIDLQVAEASGRSPD